jgi:hypothetical protein
MARGAEVQVSSVPAIAGPKVVDSMDHPAVIDHTIVASVGRIATDRRAKIGRTILRRPRKTIRTTPSDLLLAPGPAALH